jgi:predicted transporter
MELKALILGLVFSLGIFALKNGLGLHYLLQAHLARSKRKILAVLGYCLTYAVIFLIAWWVLQRLDLLGHIQLLQQLLESGMLLHGILAGLLIIWGLYLLKNDLSGERKSRGWLPLVLPCPVCLVVIFFNISFLLSFFPQAGVSLALATWAGFIAVSLLTAWVLKWGMVLFRISPEFFLGGAMLGIASFFLLSIIVMPQFGQLEEIYGLASYESNKPNIKTDHLAFLIAFLLAVFTLGFISANRKRKGFRLWMSERS